MKRSHEQKHVYSRTKSSAMDRSDKIHVLKQLNSYIPLIKAYNAESFVYSDRRTFLHRIFWAFCATVIILVLPIFAIVAIWYLIEKDAGLKKFIVAFPILFGLLQVEVTYITLVMKNHSISEMIDRLQRMIDQRKNIFSFTFLNPLEETGLAFLFSFFLSRFLFYFGILWAFLSISCVFYAFRHFFLHFFGFWQFFLYFF